MILTEHITTLFWFFMSAQQITGSANSFTYEICVVHQPKKKSYYFKYLYMHIYCFLVFVQSKGISWEIPKKFIF